MKNVQLHIAITGEAGVGKSTFVNAFRGIGQMDDGAARSDGRMERTMKPTPYPHPKFPNVTLWDLPGIGTTKFPSDQYLKLFEFERFDFFILVSADEFIENDAKLAQEIKKMGKKLYFVRSKIDNNLHAEQKIQKEYDQEKTLKKIRENCIQGLVEQGVASPQVFLVSNFDLSLYDFPALQETMERELPSHKRDVLTLAIPNISISVINKKKEVFRSQIKYFASLSAAVAAVPVPGLSVVADLGILVDMKNVQLHIAITGERGVGKSTFVNAFRGIDQMDDGAARSAAVERTMKPTSYPHPKFPNVTLWDLPGIGTTKFPSDQYLKLVEFQRFDFFILVSADRFKENDAKLAQEIKKMGKKFYFVRSKIDNNLRYEQRIQKEYGQQKTLQKIRENCIQGLEEQGVASPQVFLVNSFDLSLYDFPALQETMERELPSHKRDVLILAHPNISISVINKKKEVFRSQIKYFASLSAAAAAVPIPGLSVAADLGIRCRNGLLQSLEEKLIQKVTEKEQGVSLMSAKELVDTKNVQLHIAITGERGVGKSTFVNAFRGIDQMDDGAACSGVVERTMTPTSYPHPKFPNVTLWDLPGIGTTNFPSDQYLKLVEFERFDFFILVSADRFRENDAKLAQEIKKMGKKFYFVRSKIDNNLRDEQRIQKEYDQQKTLQKIRENCIQGLKEQGVASPQVFLVSSFDLSSYDFPAFQETMEREMPLHKRDVLILAHPNISISVINKKKEVFRSQIKYFASLSAAAAAVPIPGLSVVADVGIVVGVLRSYLLGFGLDQKSLEKISRATNTPLCDLQAVTKSPCSGKEITKELVHSLLRSLSVVGVCMAAEEGFRWIPFIGIPLAAGLSFTAIYKFLSFTLDSLSVDAENVLKLLDRK
ncbi:unnamed protein product [Lota lota]